jgi:hypothetical protein
MRSCRVALPLFGLIAAFLLAPPALAATGGPDAFGYTWIDSAAAGGPAYNATSLPASPAFGLCGDEWYTVPIGFLFDFYGNLYSQAVISANGVLYLANTSQNTPAGPDAFNSCPLGAGANPTIAPLWDDYYADSDLVLCGGPSWIFSSSVGHLTSGSAPNRVFSLSWVNNTLVSCGSGGATFTVHLFEADGAVEFHYQDVSFGAVACDGGASASVGIADSGLASGAVLDVVCNTGSISAGYAVRFEPPVAACSDGDGDGFDDDACGGSDCDDGDPAVFPGAVELCNGIDDDCDGSEDESIDVDVDGYPGCGGSDCDDADPAIHPTATELCNGLDDDCDGVADEGFDVDGDGWGVCTATPDCWEGSASVYPGAPEAANGVDDDCDGDVDEGTDAYDDDGDGYSEDGGDCDDDDPAIFPGAVEFLDATDEDCDGDVDEGTGVFDDDGDGSSEAQGDCDDSDPGVGPQATEVAANGIDDDCDGVVDDFAGITDGDGDGFSLDADCDDADADVHPGAVEAPNTVDDDCDGLVDEGTELYDDDGDGFTELDGDCVDGDPGIHPGADELPDGVDEDCDGDVDEGTDAWDDDGDGFTEDGGDCDDDDATAHPGADELLDGVDQDCDGDIDDGTEAWDHDGDGLSALDGDCDDADPWVSPASEEVCDTLDNDCDGDVDEGCEDEVAPPPAQEGCSGSLAGRVSPGRLVAALALLGLLGATRRRRRLRRIPGRLPLLALLLPLGLLAAGCSSDVTINPGLGDLSITPELLDFGPVPLGATAESVIYLDNTGTATLSIASMSLQGDDADAFELLEATTLDLDRGFGAELPVRFAPPTGGLFTTTLVINSDAGFTTRRELIVRGQGASPSAQIWPLVLDFGVESGPEPLTIAADGLVRLELSELELTGDDQPFTITLPAAAGELPLEVPPDSTVSIQIEFDTSFEGPAEATMRLHTDDPLAPIVPVTLLGNVHCDSPSGLALDEDGDGFSACGGDCDDADPSAFPGAPEFLDGDDNDCDGTIDEGTDAYDDDGDGFTELDGDCDDSDAETFPGADEVVDGVDDDCDGVIDDGTEQLDDDGDGFSELGGDCDDADADVHPGAWEALDGVDDDCDGLIDDGTAAFDDDGDGVTELDGDCHDGDPTIVPGAPEIANGVDDDCDGELDEGTAWADDDGDGFTEAGGDCDDAEASVNPAAEELTGNTVDEDCDGSAD